MYLKLIYKAYLIFYFLNNFNELRIFKANKTINLQLLNKKYNIEGNISKS
jgi:hypothetical protein